MGFVSLIAMRHFRVPTAFFYFGGAPWRALPFGALRDGVPRACLPLWKLTRSTESRRKPKEICSGKAASATIDDGGGIGVMLASVNVTTTGINPSWLLMRQASGFTPMVADFQPSIGP